MRKKDEIKLSPSEMMKEMFVLNHEQRGKYVTLLMLQATYGIIDEKMYMQIVGQDEMLASLFVVAGNGYVNEMMARQLECAKRYRESRSNGKSGRKMSENKSYENHMSIIRKSYEYHIDEKCDERLDDLNITDTKIAENQCGSEINCQVLELNSELNSINDEKEKEKVKEEEEEKESNKEKEEVEEKGKEKEKFKKEIKERKKEKEELLKNDECALAFENFRKVYPGTKDGLQIEFKNFKRHKDWRECLPLLLPAIERQKAQKEANLSRGAWQPEWRHLKTWVNQRGWEDEIAPAQPQSKSNYRHPTIAELDWE